MSAPELTKGPSGGPTQDPGPRPATLTTLELARWAWRQLTSMRTALLLLFLLALAAVPGSLIPQSNVDPSAVSRWQGQHPQLTPIYEKLGLFSVYGSVWFSAIYLLLMVSLVGCVLPRLRQYWRAIRARPPKTPLNLSRLPAHHELDLDAPPHVALDVAEAQLRSRRFRVDTHIDSVAGERGYLREAGNLLFHACVLVTLIVFAYGKLFGFVGGVIVVTGNGFANSVSQYDDFVPGGMFNPARLQPFNLSVDAFHVRFLRGGPQSGQPESFAADLSYQARPGAPERRYTLRVNHPLTVDGTNVFLVGHGYAPVVTVRDGTGRVAYRGPVVFLPEDAMFNSFGVIKAPDARPEQLGFEGLFLPTYAFSMRSGPFSAFPAPLNPVLTLRAYHGDLGLDSGRPQSVYVLDKSMLETFTKPGGKPFRVDLAMGKTTQLPDGAGSIRFDRVDRFVKLQISQSPGKGVVLAGVLLGLLGLLGSLYVRPRRVWVRVIPRGNATTVEIAGLNRSRHGDLQADIEALADKIQRRVEETR